MSEDCISRQAVLDKKYTVEVEDMWHMTQEVEVVSVSDIKALPSVTPKQKMGRFKVVTETDFLGNESYHYECSECGFNSFFRTERYCPKCGAKIVERSNEE